MLWLRSCPRCETGDLYETSDIHGPYIACLQCGYYLSTVEEQALRRFGPVELARCHKQPAVEEEPAALAGVA